ncbi:MAG: oxidoreductase [Melioribacteraceae bacterium]|nr:MAG: oxidoreductase [Melioribacteraceae bacterium]
MNNEKIKLAIIGAGRWGFNHVRTALGILAPENITICDSSDASLARVKELNEKINLVKDLSDVLGNQEINAVIIATPAETHYDIAKKTLNAGKNTFVEKPITLKSSDAEELLQLSIEKELKLMVGHILLYHPAILKIKQEVENKKIGKLQYIYSNRLNLGALRSEENILWSFAPHDISIIQYITGANPVDVKSHGATFLQHDIEDTTLTYLTYPDNVHAHIYVSWLHPFKEQRMIVIGDVGMFVFEDTLKTEKLKFYPKGFKKVNGAFEKFDGDYEVVDFEPGQPLMSEQQHFFDAINNNTKPVTDGQHALDVLRILEKAQEGLKQV